MYPVVDTKLDETWPDYHVSQIEWVRNLAEEPEHSTTIRIDETNGQGSCYAGQGRRHTQSHNQQYKKHRNAEQIESRIYQLHFELIGNDPKQKEKYIVSDKSCVRRDKKQGCETAHRHESN